MIRTFRHDKIAQNFLVRDSSNAQMCLACHDPNRVVQGQVNPLAGFTSSIHQTRPIRFRRTHTPGLMRRSA